MWSRNFGECEMAWEPERGARKRVHHTCGYELVTEVGDVFGADWNQIRRDLGLYVPEDDRGAAGSGFMILGPIC